MFKQIELPYSYEGLEPAIDALTVETHYSKHHATYTKKFNELAENAGIADKPAEVILAHWKRKFQGKNDGMAIRNNGGGYYNHNLYFGQLSPGGGGAPTGELAAAIDEACGSFDAFKEKISGLAVDQFGSGYAWLSTDENGKLSLSKLPNQDNPILESEGARFPIFCIDVWEHAYYLKYKNLRPEYVKAFFGIVNWEQIARNYAKAREKIAGLKK